MLTLGEVHTGLLQHATALSPAHCERILTLREGEAVIRSQRPIPFAASPEMLTGVDCRMPSQTGRQVRGAGTVHSCVRSRSVARVDVKMIFEPSGDQPSATSLPG